MLIIITITLCCQSSEELHICCLDSSFGVSSPQHVRTSQMSAGSEMLASFQHVVDIWLFISRLQLNYLKIIKFWFNLHFTHRPNFCESGLYLITMHVKIHHPTIITIPPLASSCLTGEEDRAPGDKKGGDRWEMRHVCEWFYKNILCHSCPSEPGWMSPLNPESLIWILHERRSGRVTQSAICSM